MKRRKIDGIVYRIAVGFGIILLGAIGSFADNLFEYFYHLPETIAKQGETISKNEEDIRDIWKVLDRIRANDE